MDDSITLLERLTTRLADENRWLLALLCQGYTLDEAARRITCATRYAARLRRIVV